MKRSFSASDTYLFQQHKKPSHELEMASLCYSDKPLLLKYFLYLR